MPSKRFLSNHLNVSINTVDTAYQMLVAEGYLTARAKSGFYVCALPKSIKADFVPQKSVKSTQKPKWKYNFETGSIDTALFPFKQWCRIEREVTTSPSLLNHGDKQGDENLRTAIADYLREFRAVKCNAGQIIVGAGIEYLLCILARMFKTKKIAIEDPGYERAARVFTALGAKCVYVPVDKHGLQVDKLIESGSEVAYLTPSHQFPTGVTMPVTRRHEMLAWACENKSRFIIEDDYNSEFRFDSRPIPSLQGLDENGKVVYVGTFSKSVAPSIRVAYMVLPFGLLEQYEKEFSFFSSTVSRFEQQALFQFIDKGHFARHLNRLRLACKARRDVLVSALAAAFGERVEIRASHTGLHLLATFKVGLSEAELIAIAEASGVHMKGLDEYYHIKPFKAEPTLVLGYAAMSEADIINAVEILKTAFLNNL